MQTPACPRPHLSAPPHSIPPHSAPLREGGGGKALIPPPDDTSSPLSQQRLHSAPLAEMKCRGPQALTQWVHFVLSTRALGGSCLLSLLGGMHREVLFIKWLSQGGDLAPKTCMPPSPSQRCKAGLEIHQHPLRHRPLGPPPTPSQAAVTLEPVMTVCGAALPPWELEPMGSVP